MTNIIFTFFVKSERSISRQITSVATCVKHENHWKWTIKGKQPLLFRPKRVIQKLFVRMKKNAGSVPKKKKWTKGSTIITHLRTIQLWSMLETLLKTLNINSSDCMVMKPFDRGVILFFVIIIIEGYLHNLLVKHHKGSKTYQIRSLCVFGNWINI